MSNMRLTDVLRFRRPSVGPSAAEAVTVPPKTQPNTHWHEFSRFTERLKREIRADDWDLLGQFYQDYTHEDLVNILDMPMEKIRAEAARLRWELKSFSERHGFDHDQNPLIKGFLTRAFSLLARQK